MAPHSSTLAWKIPWTEEPGRLQSMARLHFHFLLSCIGEGNSNPLQCSCLENPRDGRAWRAAVYGVAQNRTRLKWLSSSSSRRKSLGSRTKQTFDLKAQSIKVKVDKLDPIKIKNCSTKDCVKSEKDKPQTGRQYLQTTYLTRSSIENI